MEQAAIHPASVDVLLHTLNAGVAMAGAHCMTHSVLYSIVAALALAWATCEAFYVPIACIRPVVSPREIRSLNSVRNLDAVAGDDLPFDGDDAGVSSYPGPMVPRVGGTMPEKRPDWFRVPAPGGKDTKVCSNTFFDCATHIILRISTGSASGYLPSAILCLWVEK